MDTYGRRLRYADRCHDPPKVTSLIRPTEELDKRAPISVKFEIPYFTVSGIQVRYLKIVEKSGYSAYVSFLLVGRADGAQAGRPCEKVEMRSGKRHFPVHGTAYSDRC